MIRYSLLYLLSFLLLATSCDKLSKLDEVNEGDQFSSKLKRLSQKEYPDNPDIPLRHPSYGTYDHKDFVITKAAGDDWAFDIQFTPANEETDTILLEGIKLAEMMPTIPEWLRKDDYLSLVDVVNQEWNRQQVQFDDQHFTIKGKGDEKHVIKRVDIARNCLNAYLWEVILYGEKEDGSLGPVYHGWFDFPRNLYAYLFEQRNGISFDTYKEFLEDWKDPGNKEVNFTALRSVNDERKVDFESRNHMMYPMEGERKKKFQNIIKPSNPSSMDDFLYDSTLFATFSPPGFYDTSDPRETELGRLANLEEVIVRETTVNNDPVNTEAKELELIFSHRDDPEKKTKFFVGGLTEDDIPELSESNVYEGFQMPMGIANHSFYESYETMLQRIGTKNPYYGILTDEKHGFLDSHDIGIDGPLIYFD